MKDADFVRDYLHVLRTQFYPDDAAGFGQQKTILIDAITTPARWLDERGVKLPEKQLRSIMDEIIVGVKRFGDTANIGYFCRYFLKVVQDHMRFQGERYYEEGKSLRHVTEQALEFLSSKQRAKLPDAQDDTTTKLADLNRLMKATQTQRRKEKAATSAARKAQMDLFQ